LGHHLLKHLLLLLVPEAVLLLVVALAVVILVVVVLVGVELLPLGVGGDEVGGVAALEAAPRRSHPLLAELVQDVELSCNRVISSSGMLSYCSLEAAAKEDKTNSKADETMVLVGLASWSPT
jgi:alkylated DNA nucleotide flippase Atl1